MKSFLSLWVSQVLKGSSARFCFFHEALKYIRPAFVPIAEDISRTVQRTSLVRNKVLYQTSRSYSIVSMFVLLLIRQMHRLWRPRTSHVSMISFFSNSWLGSLELDLRPRKKRSNFGIWAGPPCRKSFKIVRKNVKTTRREKYADLGDVSKTGSVCGSFFSIFEIVFTSFTYHAKHRHAFFSVFLYLVFIVCASFEVLILKANLVREVSRIVKFNT